MAEVQDVQNVNNVSTLAFVKQNDAKIDRIADLMGRFVERQTDFMESMLKAAKAKNKPGVAV